MRKHRGEWEKIFANVICNKGLIPPIFKELLYLNIKNPQNHTPIKKKKRSEDLNRHFSREEMQMTTGHMIRCSPPLRYQGNANQNHSEILHHTCQNGFYQKDN